MKQVTLNIPDKKFPFFMELIKNLGYVKMEENNLSKEVSYTGKLVPTKIL